MNGVENTNYVYYSWNLENEEDPDFSMHFCVEDGSIVSITSNVILNLLQKIYSKPFQVKLYRQENGWYVCVIIGMTAIYKIFNNKTDLLISKIVKANISQGRFCDNIIKINEDNVILEFYTYSSFVLKLNKNVYYKL